MNLQSTQIEEQNEEHSHEHQEDNSGRRWTDEERLARLEDSEQKVLAEMDFVKETYQILITELKELSLGRQKVDTRSEETNNNIKQLIEWMSALRKK